MFRQFSSCRKRSSADFEDDDDDLPWKCFCNAQVAHDKHCRKGESTIVFYTLVGHTPKVNVDFLLLLLLFIISRMVNHFCFFREHRVDMSGRDSWAENNWDIYPSQLSLFKSLHVVQPGQANVFQMPAIPQCWSKGLTLSSRGINLKKRKHWLILIQGYLAIRMQKAELKSHHAKSCNNLHVNFLKGRYI